jgi:membrane-associated phospholipid phosphatase
MLMAPWWRSRALHRLAAAAGIVGCLAVGAAMVYLGGHWLSDVLVGWALGAGVSAAVMLLSRRVRRREKVSTKPGITSPPSGERRMPG